MAARLSIMRRSLRWVARVLRLRGLAGRIEVVLPHGRRDIDYLGFTVVHRRGNSLVARIERLGAYERETIDRIASEVAASDSRIFVDVGANIGLVSLGVLAAVRDARIYAFEPGPEQHALFAETIRRNKLEPSIALLPVALSDVAGRAPFAVHASRRNPGDGLLDTGRAGRSRSMTVPTDTLDRWWTGARRPAVAFVKLDTEGSELMILRGARAMLAACRPALYVEIHEDNLRVYPYGPDDVFRELEGLGYRLEPLTRADFIARPR